MSNEPPTSPVQESGKLYFPPLLQFLIYGLFGYALARVFPAMSYESAILYWASIPLAVLGLLVLLAAVRSFGRTGTTINPIEPDKADQLVMTGLYRFTRNPMYLGMLLVLVAGTLFLQNAAALGGAILYMASMTFLQIMPEERVLEQKFGEAFSTYRKQTRRWF